MPRIVFRGSRTVPQVKFRDGFQPRNARDEGIQIQPGGQMIGGVSTSKDLGSAVRYAGNYEGYAYAIYMVEGVDVLDYIIDRANRWFGGGRWEGGIQNAVTQMEIAMPTVETGSIIAARQCERITKDDGKTVCRLVGKVHLNEHCNAPDDIQRQGRAWLSAEIEVSAEYEDPA